MMLQTTCFRSFGLGACSSLCTRARSEHTEMYENYSTEIIRNVRSMLRGTIQYFFKTFFRTIHYSDWFFFF